MDPCCLTSDELGRLRRYGQHFSGTDNQEPAPTPPKKAHPVQDKQPRTSGGGEDPILGPNTRASIILRTSIRVPEFRV